MVKKWIKKLLHMHKYTELRMYPPRPQYGSHEWRFLLCCECGHCVTGKSPRGVKQVTEMVPTPF
jgi:hypothetical protein